VEKQNTIIKNLEIFHNKKKISPLNFNCKHYLSCVSRAQNKQKFTKGHGIWIGTEYEKGKIPKLLFLSLDSGSAELDPNKRTMEAAREWNLKWLPGKGDKPKHWYRTQQFAWHVFNEINHTFNTGLDIGNVDEGFDFDPLTEIHKIKPYYAATNSAKCCMNNEHRSQADSILFENCREHILGELAILNPDIFITQGKYARMVAEDMKIKKILHEENISGASRREDDFHVVQMDSGKILIWVHHYHPNNYGTFKKNRDKYITYAKRAVEFIKNIRTDTNTSFFFETNDKSRSLSDRVQGTDLEVDEPRRTQNIDNEKIKTKAQVKKLNVLEEWKYTEEWLDKKFGDGIYKKDEIAQALQSETASNTIRVYIYHNGPEFAPVQRHINRFIDMVNEGQFDQCKNYQERWDFIYRLESFPNSFLQNTDTYMDELNAYNYQKAPAQIVKIVDNLDAKQREAKEVLDVLVEQLSNITEQKEQEEREYNYEELLSDYEREQEQIEITHSKVREGIVYVLINELMPGLVTIGFTAGNPDKRAAYISEQYSLPSPFLVAGYVRTVDPYIVEQRIHTELADCRVSGEFFKIDVDDALNVVRKYSIT